MGPVTVTGTTSRADSREAAFRYCEGLARTHYENFTVGSLLIPRKTRRYVHVVYAYCRWVDDLGDESAVGLSKSLASAGWHPPSAAKLDSASNLQTAKSELLDAWRDDLDACYDREPSHPVMVALQDMVQRFDIPREPFLKLIEANRMEQRSNRYPTYQDLAHYCDHSANPVGRLFLYLFGYRDEERQRLSDLTCTALQLANFWQDVARDYRMGRIYIPLEDMARFNYTEEQLAQGVVNDDYRRLMAFEVDRAKGMFQEGLKLVDTLDSRINLDVALFTAGGTAVLHAIERQGYDVFSRRPSLSRARKAMLFLSTWASMRLVPRRFLRSRA